MAHLSFADDPGFRRACADLVDQVWPEFMLYDPAGDWLPVIYERFPECQVVLLDDKQRVAAIGNTVPVWWSGRVADLPERGWDAIIKRGATGKRANALSALQAMVRPDLQGQGWSQRVVGAMRAVALGRGYRHLIAPVRPSQKHRYPLIPIARYVGWRRADGLPFDSWLRVHARLGARMVKIAHRSMHIAGTLAEWEARTGLVFPGSGDFLVPGALVPVTADRTRDRVRYVEPNVWMVHTL